MTILLEKWSLKENKKADSLMFGEEGEGEVEEDEREV